MTNRVSQAEARHIFGADAAGYDAGRPDYPAVVYDIIADRCGLAPGIAAFEIGPGTGHATRAILNRGVASVIAIEPDPALAAYLRDDPQLDPARLRIVASTFADTALSPETFDLGIAAASFHWLDAAPSLAKVAEVLRPGGGWAMWWTIHRDPGSDDPFERASDAIFTRYPMRQSRGTHSVLPYGLDRDARVAELSASGLVGIRCDMMRWSMRMDAAATLGLLASFSPVRLLASADRTALMADFRTLVERDFGGVVDRWFTTAVYTARKPAT